jgi:hypothetical protein
MKKSESQTPAASVVRSFIRTLAPLVLAALVSACGGGSGDGSDEPVVCTTEARTSVLLMVIDQVGAPLPGVTASYRVDGGAAQSQPCNASGACPLAFEVSGVFAFTASKPGYTSQSGTVTVKRDACHVITERVTLALTRAA